MSYHLAGNRMTKLPLMFRVRMEGPAGDPEAFSQLPTFYQRWLIVKGKWLDSSASIGFKTEPGPLCLTPRCPPMPLQRFYSLYSVPVIWARMRKERDCRLEDRRAHSSASSSGLLWFLITAWYTGEALSTAKSFTGRLL